MPTLKKKVVCPSEKWGCCLKAACLNLSINGVAKAFADLRNVANPSSHKDYGVGVVLYPTPPPPPN